MRTLRSLLTVALLALLTACGSDPPPPEPQRDAAGEAYLAAVCPVNEAWDEVDAAIDALQIAVDRGAGDPAAVRAALTRLANRADRAAAQLDSAAWPASARTAVAAVAAALRADADRARRAQEFSAREVVDYAWPGIDDTADRVRDARRALGVPAGCAEPPATGGST